jgi:uncharacterized SAM-binding protein YcdF (DUF218 family)
MIRVVRSIVRIVAILAVTALVSWTVGFIWFVQAATRTGDPVPHTDGIVALTGGGGRVELALRLMAHGQADKLLVSGIGGGTDLMTLGRLAGIETAPLADRIELGRHAASTRGNAAETAAWAEQHHIGSLIVVTAAYHMPRALLELHQALPAVRLFPLPVVPPPGAGDRGPGWRLEAEEFTKYMLALAGLSGWFPHREPAVPVRLSMGANR